MNSLCLLGTFPPPITGQTMATKRLADLLDAACTVHRISTSSVTEQIQAEVRFSLSRAQHYVRQRRALRETLAATPGAPVLWTSVSPTPLGHFRDLITVLPAFQPGQPIYAVSHWGNFDRLFRSPLTAVTGRHLARRVQQFVFLTDQLAAACAPWLPAEQRAVIPNTIDEAVLCTDEEVNAKQARRPERTRLRLLFLSNMIPSKGYLDVLHATDLLHQRGLPFHLDYVGRWSSDDDRSAFEQVVAAKNVSAVVTHHGGIADRARIKQLYLDADVFLLPSYYAAEAQPLAILEALNAGTPVVATRHAGIPEMVQDGQEALLVPPRSPQALADAVERLADTPTWQRFSMHARERFLTRFSPDAVRRQWLKLLASDE